MKEDFKENLRLFVAIGAVIVCMGLIIIGVYALLGKYIPELFWSIPIALGFMGFVILISPVLNWWMDFCMGYRRPPKKK